MCVPLICLHLWAPSILQQENISRMCCALSFFFSFFFFFLWQSQVFDRFLLPPLFSPSFKFFPATCCWELCYTLSMHSTIFFFFCPVSHFHYDNQTLMFPCMVMCAHLSSHACHYVWDTWISMASSPYLSLPVDNGFLVQENSQQEALLKNK